MTGNFTRRVLGRLPRRAHPRLTASVGAAVGVCTMLALVPLDVVLSSAALPFVAVAVILVAAASRL